MKRSAFQLLLSASILFLIPYCHAADNSLDPNEIEAMEDRIERARQDGIYAPISAYTAMQFIEAPQGSKAAQLWREWECITQTFPMIGLQAPLEPTDSLRDSAESIWKGFIAQSALEDEQRRTQGLPTQSQISELREMLKRGATQFDATILAKLKNAPSNSPEARLFSKIRQHLAVKEVQEDIALFQEHQKALEKRNEARRAILSNPLYRRPLFCCVGDYKRWQTSRDAVLKVLNPAPKAEITSEKMPLSEMRKISRARNDERRIRRSYTVPLSFVREQDKKESLRTQLEELCEQAYCSDSSSDSDSDSDSEEGWL